MNFTGESEELIETERQNLCKILQFEPFAAFQRIDRKNKGHILAKDIQGFMK